MANTFWNAIDGVMGTTNSMNDINEETLAQDLRKHKVKGKEIHVKDDIGKQKAQTTSEKKDQHSQQNYQTHTQQHQPKQYKSVRTEL